MISDIGNYFQRQTFPDLIINEETATPKFLSKLIRSGTSQSEILAAIKIAKVVTNENLCDALDRDVPSDIFQALIDKVESIGESVLSCAIYQNRSQKILEMLNSGKIHALSESLLQKTSKVKLEISNRMRRETVEAIKLRNFVEARSVANNIPDEAIRKGTMAEIAAMCFEFGDREAIECALDVAKMHKENREDFICDFIEQCKNLKDKEMAGEMLTIATIELDELLFNRQRLIGY